jgi:hypothetical protein
MENGIFVVLEVDEAGKIVRIGIDWICGLMDS